MSIIIITPVVVGGLEAVSERLDTWLDELGITIKPLLHVETFS